MSTNEPAISYRAAKAGSDRSFGLVFAAFFAIVGLGPAVHAQAPRLWAVGAAALFALVAFVAPHVLSPLHRIWLHLGVILHHVVNPIVMGLVYVAAVVPTALIVRARGKDLLRLKRDPAAESYWIKRDPPGPAASSMSNQF
jgi:Saxitoxin biosynthesis operon protein SxtJ